MYSHLERNNSVSIQRLSLPIKLNPDMVFCVRTWTLFRESRVCVRFAANVPNESVVGALQIGGVHAWRLLAALDCKLVM
jgi:hypothetical protein